MDKRILDKLCYEDYTDGYYHFSEDLKKYPDAWCYVVYSQRGPGKTYSALRYYLGQQKTIAYMKRTNDDVDIICASDSGLFYDLSPYKDINRDFGTDIHGQVIKKGLGGFWQNDSQGKPSGAPIGYAVSLNSVAKYKGMGLSECEAVILDEFIPQKNEVVRRSEGEALLDFYMTVRRDRLKRGKPDLKLILFANGVNIYTPVTDTLEIIDDMAQMEATRQRYKYIEDRGILLHHIYAEDVSGAAAEKASGINKAMQDTAWGRVSLGGELANNDFSNVAGRSIKRMRPLIEVVYKLKNYYIYAGEDGSYYACKSRGECIYKYDLQYENDQKAFFYNWIPDLREACIEGRMKFSHYSMYDLVVNYKKHFTT